MVAMSILNVLAEEAHELAPLVLPIWAFPLIALVFFVICGLITVSFRDVSHRRLDKDNAAHGHGEHGHSGH